MRFLRFIGLAWIRLDPAGVGQVGGIDPRESFAKSLRAGIRKTKGPIKPWETVGWAQKASMRSEKTQILERYLV
jgi:hypothetical protein